MQRSQAFDVGAYEQRSQGPCFICEMLAGNPAYRHHLIYEDQAAVVFLSKYPTLAGYTLVAPRAHREQATGDFTLEEYLALQQLIYRVVEAIRHTVPTERIYILTLGSQQGNRHVHWHIAPLPPGVPYEDQQATILDLSRGILPLSEEEMEALSQAIRQALDHPDSC
ncbi:MAG TPA: HIT family protein [Ktedonobacterales bacterium]|jgi:diadenosine tetraphosphate (Ap4A) HIT family hydrolase